MCPEAPLILESQPKILALLDSMRGWLQREENRKAIAEQAGETRAWLSANTENFDADGNLEKGAWWPTLPISHDETILLIRRVGLLDKVSEHGWRHMFAGLVERGVIHAPAEATFELASTSGRSLIHELVADHLTDGEEKQLGDLAKRFGIEPTKFRNRNLVRLAAAGIITARYIEGYGIKIGPIGAAFVRDVFTPTIAAFEPQTKGREQ